MNPNVKYGMIAALAGLAGCGNVNADTSKETVVTNADGTVTKTRTESRDIKDSNGNVIGHEESTFSETTNGTEAPTLAKAKDEKPVETDSFLGLKFGEIPAGADKAEDVPNEPALKVVKFAPKKTLKGFDDYFAYVTPKTHKLVKVCACAKKAVDGGAFGRRHYLVEALENRYRCWARLASWNRPLYVFEVSPKRGVSICLTDASDDYETVICAWDDDAARLAAEEHRELKDAAYRQAVEQRASQVKEAQAAF